MIYIFGVDFESNSTLLIILYRNNITAFLELIHKRNTYFKPPLDHSFVMTTTLVNMPSAVSFPCFIPASKTSDGNLKNDDVIGLLNDVELDFDLLADYLLEEADVTDFR